MDFYVACNFQLPADGPQGIPEMISNHIGVLPNNSSWEKIKAVNEPIPLATLHDKSLWCADKHTSGTLMTVPRTSFLLFMSPSMCVTTGNTLKLRLWITTKFRSA